MIKIYDYNGHVPPFVDIIVDDLSVAQIDYCNIIADDDYEHITLLDDEDREFCNVVCDEYIIIP